MDNHDRGLAYDLKSLLNRRRALFLLGGASLTALAACSSAETTATAATTTTVKACTEKIPEETAGPYPGDGSNGPNILTASGIVRSDIRSSFGSASAVVKGIPLTIKLNLQKDCAAYADAAI